MKPVIFTLLVLFTLGLYCQSPQTSFVLDEPVNHDVTKDYVASQYIQMIPNFWAHSNEDHHVWAKIDPLLVFPPEEGEETEEVGEEEMTQPEVIKEKKEEE